MKILKLKNSLKHISQLCLLVLLITSCKKDPAQDLAPIVFGDAKMSITNTVSGSNAQEFYQNDTKISTSAIAYGETSSYYTIKAGNSTLAFKNIGSTTASSSLQVTLDTDFSYTTFYYVDQVGTPRITGFSDDVVAPAAGKIKVRFVNLAPALNNTLNISRADNTALVNGLSFGNVNPTGYILLDATTALQVSVVNSGISVPIPASNFTSGKIYTIWFDAANTTTAKFHVIQQN